MKDKKQSNKANLCKQYVFTRLFLNVVFSLCSAKKCSQLHSILNYLHKVLQTLLFLTVENSHFFYLQEWEKCLNIWFHWSSALAPVTKLEVIQVAYWFCLPFQKRVYLIRDEKHWSIDFLFSDFSSTAQSVCIVISPNVSGTETGFLSHTCFHGITAILIVRDLQGSFRPPWASCSR